MSTSGSNTSNLNRTAGSTSTSASGLSGHSGSGSGATAGSQHVSGSTAGHQSGISGQQQQPSTAPVGSGSGINVQSQVATAVVSSGAPQTSSNLQQVVGDLGALQSAHSKWVQDETAKIDQWGRQRIESILAQAKGVEEGIIREAQEKQRKLEESHKLDLERLVQRLDSEKARKLKELEDGMQRQIQAALTNSKNEVNGIESEMNERKMKLLQQSQAQAAKDTDHLSQLVVEAKLQPSATETIIKSSTETGTVVAVAGGGEISTGSAQSQRIGSQVQSAAPTGGQLRQDGERIEGDIIATNQQGASRKVGEGSITNTMTDVSSQPAGVSAGANKNIGSTASTASTASTSGRGINQGSSAVGYGTGVSQSTGGVSQSRSGSADVSTSQKLHGSDQRPGESAPVDHGRQGGTDSRMYQVVHDPSFNADKERVGGAGSYDATSVHGSKGGAGYDASTRKEPDAAYGKPSDRDLDSSSGGHHKEKEGFMSKVKHALTGSSSDKHDEAHRSREPTSTEATRQ